MALAHLSRNELQATTNGSLSNVSFYESPQCALPFFRGSYGALHSFQTTLPIFTSSWIAALELDNIPSMPPVAERAFPVRRMGSSEWIPLN